jgi:hypothetical protein
VCCTAGAIVAWKRGLGGSFVIFVLAFFALPFLLMWDRIILPLFPPKSLELVTSPIQTLDLSQK